MPSLLTQPNWQYRHLAPSWAADTRGDVVGLFKRKKPAAAKKSPDHAVIVHFKLSDDEHGTVEERESVFALEDQLERAIEGVAAGEFDGNEFGGGEAVLYAYGPDADALFAAMEAPLRAFPNRPAFAILRYGEATDATAPERRVAI